MKKIYVTGNNPDKKQIESFLSRFCDHYDENYFYFENLALTTQNKEAFDGALVINGVMEPETINVIPENIVAFMMEPGIKGEHRWMYTKLGQYGKVISPVNFSPNTITEHGYISWFLPQSRNTLANMPVPEKKYDASCISSGKDIFSGHKKRLDFVRYLRAQLPSIHYFGFDGLPFLTDKTPGLAPFRFSIAIENSRMENYFTEKINDCFLMYTIPLYYGCTNLDKFFPKGSYIWIDINNYEKAKATIEDAIATVKWEDKLPLLQEARAIILKKYHALARMEKFMTETNFNTGQKECTLTPVEQTLLYKLYKKIVLLAGGTV